MTLPVPGRAPGHRAIAAIDAALVGVNRALVVGLMASMAVLVFANVVGRYVFGRSIIWVEELTQYQMIWVAYLGAGLALRQARLVAVDTLQDLLPAGVRRMLRAAIGLVIVAFLLVLAWFGSQIVLFTWSQETPVLNVPTGLPYLAVPLGAAGLLMHLLLFWRRFVDRDFEPVDDAADALPDGDRAAALPAEPAP